MAPYDSLRIVPLNVRVKPMSSAYVIYGRAFSTNAIFTRNMSKIEPNWKKKGLTVTVPKGAKRPQKEAKKGRPAGSTGSTAITPMRPCKASRRQKNMSETSVRA